MSEHQCKTPRDGWPGDTWHCPVCHREWTAGFDPGFAFRWAGTYDFCACGHPHVDHAPGGIPPQSSRRLECGKCRCRAYKELQCPRPASADLTQLPVDQTVGPLDEYRGQ
jgi:hypothetical protein